MFEEVESNISKIISHCLHESISNKTRSPFYISPSQIIGFFPDELSINDINITQQFSAGWQICNNIINCYFGLKVICNNNKTKEWIMNIMNNNHQNNNDNPNKCNSLFIQPINIENGFISKQIKSEWNKLNNKNYNGLICRFNAMNECHEFGVIPFVKCTQFNMNLINHNNQKSDNKMFSENNQNINDNKKEQYDDWYYQQYLDYYGYNDNDNDDDNDDNDGVLQPIHENKQYDPHRNDEDDNDEDEDIDLMMNYNRNITMKGSMNRERKRRFNECDGDDMMNPYKRRKYNHCNNTQMTEF